MDNLITSRRARWKVFGIILLIICIFGIVKGFMSERYRSDANVESPDKTLARVIARNQLQSTSSAQPSPSTTTPSQTSDNVPLDKWVDQTLAGVRKKNAASSPDTLPGNFSDWDPPVPKTLSTCQTKISEWQRWYENNIAVFENMKTSNDQLKRENSELDANNSKLRDRLKISEPVGVFVALFGVGAGIAVIFILGKLLRRTQWPSPKLSREKKKLLLLIGGAVWVSVVVVICSQEQILYLHPINLLVAVVVYSIPAILFGGISFWWLKRPIQLSSKP